MEALQWSLHENPELLGSDIFLIAEHMDIWRQWQNLRGHKSFMFFSYFLLYASLPSGYFWVVSYYNKPVI